MIRIIGGEAKGRKIETPGGISTRPTRALVREAMFNMLQAEVRGSRVLDLFAGSGALGLEALSRGAKYAVFADSDARAANIIRKNIDALGYGGKAGVFNERHDSVIRRMMTGGALFDIILLDPPYRVLDLAELCASVAVVANNGAVLVLEHAGDAVIENFAPWELAKTRVYGETGVTLFRLGR